jgi:amidase
VNQSDICGATALELTKHLRSRALSVREVMEAHLRQIERCNPHVNAIITLVADRALEAADEADSKWTPNADLGPLFGLPIAHKDLVETKGIRTTWGSPIHRDFIPKENALIVDRLQHAGAITIGKTNVPEFGAGSQTFNPVFGETRNPYDLSKTCGGSSGGAAVALACGMQPIADGSDMGGSLRNPASFCNVVGLRTSPGRVPKWPSGNAWSPLSVQGPMARTVGDTALMLSAIAGPDPRSPIAISEPGMPFRGPLVRDFSKVRLSWSRDFGGLPVEPSVSSVIESGKHIFKNLGCLVEDDEPDFTGADEAFKVFRAASFAQSYGALLKTHRDLIKDTVIWNTEAGLDLTGADMGRAETLRTELYHRVRKFMEHHEFMIFPATQVAPFDVEQQFITEINGVKQDTYIDWMRSSYYISITGLPAISVPCGFTDTGLPVGIQIVGRHQDDFGVLQLAHAFEEATQVWKRRPPIAED